MVVVELVHTPRVAQGTPQACGVRDQRSTCFNLASIFFGTLPNFHHTVETAWNEASSLLVLEGAGCPWSMVKYGWHPMGLPVSVVSRGWCLWIFRVDVCDWLLFLGPWMCWCRPLEAFKLHICHEQISKKNRQDQCHHHETSPHASNDAWKNWGDNLAATSNEDHNKYQY